MRNEAECVVEKLYRMRCRVECKWCVVLMKETKTKQRIQKNKLIRCNKKKQSVSIVLVYYQVFQVLLSFLKACSRYKQNKHITKDLIVSNNSASNFQSVYLFFFSKNIDVLIVQYDI